MIFFAMMSRMNFRNLLVKLAKEKTILLSNHIISDIEETCERLEDCYICVINNKMKRGN